VSAVRDPRAPAFTLVEVAVVLALGGVVSAAVAGVLLGNQRFYRSQEQVLEVQRSARTAAQLLAADLRGSDGGDGDIVAMSDTAVTVKAARAFGILCALPDPSTRTVTISNTRLFGYRAIDPARDSVLLYRDGDTLLASDDRWLRAPVASIGTARCPDGAAATRVTLGGTAGGSAPLDGVTSGSPLRVFEVIRYRLYVDETRTWWLGLQSFSGGWSATSPLVGPLRPNDGVRFEFFDAGGLPTVERTAVRLVRITVRGLSAHAIAAAGRRSGLYQDSLSTRVYLRNSSRP
jgi:prepilin-type N-terminal cleavage/methylation domain-containing protein